MALPEPCGGCDYTRKCRRWRTLADDYTLWKRLCITNGWHWKDLSLREYLHSPDFPSTQLEHETTDEKER